MMKQTDKAVKKRREYVHDNPQTYAPSTPSMNAFTNEMDPVHNELAFYDPVAAQLIELSAEAMQESSGQASSMARSTYICLMCEQDGVCCLTDTICVPLADETLPLQMKFGTTKMMTMQHFVAERQGRCPIL